MRQQESSGEEIVVFRVFFLEAVEVLGQSIFPMQGVHAWVMVDLLVWGHLGQEITSNGAIIPLEIPGFGLVVLQLPTHLFPHLLDNVVLSVSQVHTNGLEALLGRRARVALHPDVWEFYRPALLVQVRRRHIVVHTGFAQ